MTDSNRVKIYDLEFDVSDDELQYLMKLPEDDRLFALCSLRYEFHVLTKQGKKKTDTLDLIKSKQAIRFAIAFFKFGKGISIFPEEKNETTE